MKSQLQIRQIAKLSTTQKVVLGTAAVLFITGSVFLVNFLSSKKAIASFSCGNNITGTETITSATSCSQDFEINGGTLIIEAEFTHSKEITIKN
ncbi:MAG: hypothetical protein KDC92_14790, partial [Bacteroidetes bacterium]|nr:hypothetical protein [Bacteroidota bacterium]